MTKKLKAEDVLLNTVSDYAPQVGCQHLIHLPSEDFLKVDD